MADKSTNIRVNVLADDKASKTIKGIGDEADTTGGKFSKLGGVAAVGGAAVVAAAVAGVMAFEQGAVAAGKMADATGLTSEQASRMTEVFADNGSSAETAEKSIGKMAKQLGANADAFAEYGIQAVKGKDGQTDVNATFLAAVDAINAIRDPLKKQEAASKVFGKGWADMADIIKLGGKGITEQMQAVSDQKVFDDKEVQQGRDLRAAFDQIVDAGEDLLLTIGQLLVPILTKLAPTLAKVIEAAEPLAISIGEVLASALQVIGPIIEALLPAINMLAKGLSLVADAVGFVADLIGGDDMLSGTKALGDELEAVGKKAADAGYSTEQYKAMLQEAGEATKDIEDPIKKMSAAVAIVSEKLDKAAVSNEHNALANRDAADAAKKLSDAEAEKATRIRDGTQTLRDNTTETRNLEAAWKQLFGVFDENDAIRGLEESFENLQTTATDTWNQTAAGTMTAEQAARNNGQAVDDLKRKVGEYAKEVGGITPKQVTDIYAQIDNGSVTNAKQVLDQLAKARQVIYNAQVSGHREFASGTESAPPGTALVGERGPELVVLPGQAKVKTANETARLMRNSGSTVYNTYTTIHMPPGISAEALVKAERRRKRRGLAS